MSYSKSNSANTLRIILWDMEQHEEESLDFAQGNLLCIDKSLEVFEGLTVQNHTENHSDHIVNYCRIKMQFARQQIERGEVAEGVEFARSVIGYFLRDGHPSQAVGRVEEVSC